MFFIVFLIIPFLMMYAFYKLFSYLFRGSKREDSDDLLDLNELRKNKKRHEKKIDKKPSPSVVESTISTTVNVDVHT